MSSGSRQLQLRVHDPLQADRHTPPTAHPADMSDPCPHPMQTDRHGHPPKGVSSCPVGENLIFRLALKFVSKGHTDKGYF